MEQVKLSIKENGQYKNLHLKKDLKKDQYTIIEKKFADGRPVNGKFGVSYSCGAVYEGEDCSFFLNEKEHNAYKDIGGIGDKIKVSKVLYDYEFKGVTKYAEKLVFEKVE